MEWILAHGALAVFLGGDNCTISFLQDRRTRVGTRWTNGLGGGQGKRQLQHLGALIQTLDSARLIVRTLTIERPICRMSQIGRPIANLLQQPCLKEKCGCVGQTRGDLAGGDGVLSLYWAVIPWVEIKNSM